jgi:hypothetical protein
VETEPTVVDSAEERPETDEFTVDNADDATTDSLESAVESCETWLDTEVDSEIIWLDCEVDRLLTALLVAEMALDVTTEALDTADDTPVSEVATEATAPCKPPIWLATVDDAAESDRLIELSAVETLDDWAL